MLSSSLTALLTANIEPNRVPTGSGIDFLVWPIMVGAFIYIVYLTTRKQPSDKGNKHKKN